MISIDPDDRNSDKDRMSWHYRQEHFQIFGWSPVHPRFRITERWAGSRWNCSHRWCGWLWAWDVSVLDSTCVYNLHSGCSILTITPVRCLLHTSSFWLWQVGCCTDVSSLLHHTRGVFLLQWSPQPSNLKSLLRRQCWCTQSTTMLSPFLPNASPIYHKKTLREHLHCTHLLFDVQHEHMVSE